jgi:putative FmdB family regulatory protein
MPIWEYDCDKCGAVVEAVFSFERRDNPFEHEGCGGNLIRRKVQQFKMGSPSFQGGAIMGDGTFVKGNWDGSYRNKKGWNPK